MKKLWTIVTLLVLVASGSRAQIEFEEIKSRTQEKLHVTGFFDYFPFGQYESNVYSGVFKPFIEYFSDHGQYVLDYLPVSMSYEDTIGEADVVLGMYAETSLYTDLKFIYPAAIDNPVHIAMLPSKIGSLHSLEDLKKMKGAIHRKERFSGYVNDKLKDFQIEYVDNSYDLFGKLIRGEIDYIFTSIYFGTIEAAKLGLRPQIAFSKQSIWTIPVFIGISKASVHREYLSHTLSKMLEKPEIREKIKNDMINIVTKVEEQYNGTVPPAYELPKNMDK